MQPDSPQTIDSLPAPAGSAPVRDKVRIRFAKTGDLRLVSHHDLLRCFERMLRRAELPYRCTKGFNPKPRMVFALSLGLGIIGRDEVVELELDASIPPEEIRARLARQAPAGLDIRDVRRIDFKTTAQVRSARYRIPVPSDHLSDLPERVAGLLAAPECWIVRTRPATRRLNLRPYLRDLRILPNALEMDIWVTPTGTVRPDEVLQELGLGDLLTAGTVMERTTLELQDEVEDTDQKSEVRSPRSELRGQRSEVGGEEPVSSPPASDVCSPISDL
jgi:radical SAM-linked protein